MKNKILVFDLHGVIFKLSPLLIIKEIFKCPYKLKLIKTFFYPRIIISTINQLRNGAIAEEILLKLEKDFHQFKELTPTGFKIINAQKPIYPTINLLKQIKSKGYKVFVFSNIGPISISILQNKFQEVFLHFDGILCSTPEDNYIKKPDLKAFEKYLEKFAHQKSNLIFIDDKLKNIETAQEIGIYGLKFINSKILKKQLISCNILDQFD